MRIFKSLLLVVPLLSVSGAAAAAEKAPTLTRADLAAADTLRERALAYTGAWQLLYSLTTEVGPRPAGSPGDRAGVAWALREMQRLGFANVRSMEVTVPRWVRGDAKFQVLTPWPQ